MIDTGDIIGQRKISVGLDDNVGIVYDKLMKIGSEMVLETVDSIITGNLKSYPQPEGEYIPAPKIFKEDCHIDWNKSAIEIHNHIRGLSPYPAAFTSLIDDKEREVSVKIFESKISDNPLSSAKSNPGEIIIEKKRMFVKCGNGIIEVLSLQPAGKKRMDTSAFLLGYKPIRFQ